MKSPIPTILGVLVGLLVLSSVLFIFGRDDARVLPTVANFKPTGVSAFAELLRQQGYQVSADPSFRPKLAPRSIAIQFSLSSQDYWFSETTTKSVDESVQRFVADGGTLITVYVPRDVNELSETLQKTPVISITNGVGNPRFSYKAKVLEGSLSDPAESSAPILVFETPGGERLSFASIHRVGKGYVVEVLEGSFVTNRFIDSADHARIALSLIAMAGPRQKSVTFVEGSLLKVQPSLWQELGPWASVTYWQIFLLGGLVVFTLGKRFGPAITDSIHVRGSRELLEAFGDLMRRAKRANLATELLYGNLDMRVRRAINLPIHADERDRNARLSPELVDALNSLRNASREEVRTRDAATLARTALRLVESLEATARSRRAGI